MEIIWSIAAGRGWWQYYLYWDRTSSYHCRRWEVCSTGTRHDRLLFKLWMWMVEIDASLREEGEGVHSSHYSMIHHKLHHNLYSSFYNIILFFSIMLFPFQYQSPLPLILHLIFQNTNSLEKVLTNILIRFSVNVLILRLCYQSVTLQKWTHDLVTDSSLSPC